MRGLEIVVTLLVFSKAPPGSDCSTNTHPRRREKTHTSTGLCSAIIFTKAFHSCTNSRRSHKPTVPSAMTLAHNMPAEPHSDILTHTHIGAPLWHFCYYFLTCVFTSTFTVIRAHIASAVLSRAKWFVMICLDRGIVFPLRMGSLDGAFSSGCVHTAGGASVFAATLSVYKEGTYCTPPLCVGCAPRTGQHIAWCYKYHAGPGAFGFLVFFSVQWRSCHVFCVNMSLKEHVQSSSSIRCFGNIKFEQT